VIAFNKCGHTSIINTFQTASIEPNVRRGLGALRAKTQRKDFDSAIVNVGFFRHPVARIASVYHYFYIATDWRVALEALGFNKDMLFPEFIEQLEVVDLSKDAHLKPQHKSWMESAQRHAPNWIERLEDIEKVWPDVVKTLKMGCTTSVAHFNSSNSYNAVEFTSDTMLRITKLYEHDMKIWVSREW
jgi:hypothetical protein